MDHYEIIKMIGNVAYRLDFPSNMSSINLIFHVSMLRKWIGVPSTIVPLEGIEVKENLSYEEFLIEILDRK